MKRGGAVEHDAEAAAAVPGRAHLGDEVHEEEQRAVAHAGQAGAEAAVVALFRVLFFDLLLNLLPLHAEGRIGEHVVEVLPMQAVGGEGVAEDDVGDVLPLDQHVGLADGVGLGVQLLSKHDEAGVGVDLGEVLVAHAEHTAGAGGGVVEGAHHAGLGQGLVVLDEEEVDHEADDLARGEVLPGGLVGQLGELADQLLEDRAHLGVADGLRVQVDGGEFLGDEVEQSRLVEAVDLGVEVEALEDVAHGGRKGLHVGAEVFADIVLVAHQLLQVERRGAVEESTRDLEEEGLRVQLRLFPLRLLRQHGVLGGLQHTVQTAEDGKGQDDLALFGLLVVATQEVGDRPDKGGKVGIRHGMRVTLLQIG